MIGLASQTKIKDEHLNPKNVQCNDFLNHDKYSTLKIESLNIRSPDLEKVRC